jgi:hypothetical protein
MTAMAGRKVCKFSARYGGNHDETHKEIQKDGAENI